MGTFIPSGHRCGDSRVGDKNSNLTPVKAILYAPDPDQEIACESDTSLSSVYVCNPASDANYVNVLTLDTTE